MFPIRSIDHTRIFMVKRTMSQLAPGLLVFVLPVAMAAQPATRITDPVSFVTDVYRHFVQSQTVDREYQPPQDIYTPRLAKLIYDDQHRPGRYLPCADFVFWVDGQDWMLSDVSISGKVESQDHRTVIARFRTDRRPVEIHFDFRLISRRWLISEVQSVLAPTWTLTAILKCQQ